MYGAVDIGTNSVRLLIANIEKGGIKPIRSELRTTRIGAGIAINGRLSLEAISRTITALKEYKNLMEQHGVRKCRLVATSAVRDAVNQKEFIRQVAESTGFYVDVISGQEEAALSYKGVAGFLSQQKQSCLVVDIGGGSTELIWSGINGDVNAFSVQAGAVRMTEQSSTDKDIEILFLPVIKEAKGAGAELLVGVGGTITTLAAVLQKMAIYDPDKIQGYRIRIGQVAETLSYLENLTLQDRMMVPGLQPQRADIICAGLRILHNLMAGLDYQELMVSEADILHGIIDSLT